MTMMLLGISNAMNVTEKQVEAYAYWLDVMPRSVRMLPFSPAFIVLTYCGEHRATRHRCTTYRDEVPVHVLGQVQQDQKREYVPVRPTQEGPALRVAELRSEHRVLVLDILGVVVFVVWR